MQITKAAVDRPARLARLKGCLEWITQGVLMYFERISMAAFNSFDSNIQGTVMVFAISCSRSAVDDTYTGESVSFPTFNQQAHVQLAFPVTAGTGSLSKLTAASLDCWTSSAMFASLLRWLLRDSVDMARSRDGTSQHWKGGLSNVGHERQGFDVAGGQERVLFGRCMCGQG
jgi:hypothetical protein